LRSRSTIDQAMGVLMTHARLTADEAFRGPASAVPGRQRQASRRRSGGHRRGDAQGVSGCRALPVVDEPCAVGARGATVLCGARGPRTGSPWTPPAPRTTICRHRGRTPAGLLPRPVRHVGDSWWWTGGSGRAGSRRAKRIYSALSTWP
jgi:hypothetical protein